MLTESTTLANCPMVGGTAPTHGLSAPRWNHRAVGSSPNPRPILTPTPVEEAAWQLLKPFVNPIDCNVAWSFQGLDGQFLTGIRPLNLNVTINALLNGDPVDLAYFTKTKFLQHCRGESKYYYRSRWNGFACTGYGSHDKAWKKLQCDAPRYALDSKKFASPRIALVLLGFDVDAHHGEHDVEKTTNLILDLFPGAYHEPSTNGLGRHIYVKLYYDINTCVGGHHATLQHLHHLCTFVGEGIECRRQRAGYDAALDRIRGLPTLIGIKRENAKPSIIHKILPNAGIIEKPTLEVTCRSLVIKIPFYRNCTETAVDQFFRAPFYSLQHLQFVQEAMFQDGTGVPEFVFHDDVQEGMNALLSGMDITEASTHTGNKHLTNNTHNSVFPAALNYQTAARNLIAVQDSHERRIEFAMLYTRHLGRVPTGQELELEYGTIGLRKAESKSDNTTYRFHQISRWLEQTFKPEKCCFGYGGYQIDRDKTEALIAKRITGLKLEWTKGNGNRPIRVARLAGLYWCMRHSQGKGSSTHFSRKQAQVAMLETLKVKCHNAEVAAMFRILEQVGLIQKAGGYCPGHFGRGWAVGELSAG